MILFALAAVASGSIIKDAATVVTFTRGFGHELLSDRSMTREQAIAALNDIRHVILHPTSFLEEDEVEFMGNAHGIIHDTQLMGNDGKIEDGRFNSVAEGLLEEDDIGHMDTVSPFPAFVSNGMSIDNGSGEVYAQKGEEDPNKVTLHVGPLQVHVIKRLQEHKLIRSVKWGTSAVPSWSVDYPVERRPDQIHHHIVSFEGEPFVTRPIVLVSIMPVCDGDPDKCDGLWTDVFVASLAHISTHEFAVNIVRLDSLPNNTWGQQIHIAYVAFEPNDVRAVMHDKKNGANDAHVTMFTD